jgi:hypothetical protein
LPAALCICLRVCVITTMATTMAAPAGRKRFGSSTAARSAQVSVSEAWRRRPRVCSQKIRPYTRLATRQARAQTGCVESLLAEV